MIDVYMAGLIYLTGCDEVAKRAFAPDGRDYDPPHYASLWIAEDDVEQDNWWSGATDKQSRSIDGVTVIEFRIPSPAKLWFPDPGDGVDCYDLEDGLAKLKKKNPDDSEEDFEIDPPNAITIAEVAILGGEIRPRRFKDITVLQWTIGDTPTRQITAVLNATGEPRTITVADSAEIVFTNIHDPSIHTPGDHAAVFKKLNPAQAGATLVSKKARGSVGHIDGQNGILNFIRPAARGEGNTPACCYPNLALA